MIMTAYILRYFGEVATSDLVYRTLGTKNTDFVFYSKEEMLAMKIKLSEIAANACLEIRFYEATENHYL